MVFLGNLVGLPKNTLGDSPEVPLDILKEFPPTSEINLREFLGFVGFHLVIS